MVNDISIVSISRLNKCVSLIPVKIHFGRDSIPRENRIGGYTSLDRFHRYPPYFPGSSMQFLRVIRSYIREIGSRQWRNVVVPVELDSEIIRRAKVERADVGKLWKIHLLLRCRHSFVSFARGFLRWGDRASIIGCLHLPTRFLRQSAPVKTENVYCTKHDHPFLKRILFGAVGE